MAGTYGKYPAIAGGGGGGGASFQVAIGTAATTTGTTTSGTGTFATFSNTPTVSITPTATGTYMVFGHLQVSCDTITTVTCRVFPTTGTVAATLAEQADRWFVPGNNYTNTVCPYSVYTLTIGVAYTFSVQGYTGGGTFSIRNDLAAAQGYGNYLVVQRIA